MRKVAIALLLAFGLAGCSLLNPGPEGTVKKFYAAVEKGELEDAMNLLSAKILSMGKDKIRAGLAQVSREMKQKGGVKKLDITKMEVNGEVAEGQVKLDFGDGSSKTENVKLIKEEGKWKLDADK